MLSSILQLTISLTKTLELDQYQGSLVELTKELLTSLELEESKTTWTKLMTRTKLLFTRWIFKERLLNRKLLISKRKRGESRP
jgi:hypothetical protein